MRKRKPGWFRKFLRKMKKKQKVNPSFLSESNGQVLLNAHRTYFKGVKDFKQFISKVRDGSVK